MNSSRCAWLACYSDWRWRQVGLHGLSPQEELEILADETQSFVKSRYRCWNDKLHPGLCEQGIRILPFDELDGEPWDFAVD